MKLTKPTASCASAALGSHALELLRPTAIRSASIAANAWCPASAASSLAVRYSLLSSSFGFAPACSSTCTSGALPNSAAHMSAVRPSSSRPSISVGG